MTLYKGGIPEDITLGRLKPDLSNFRFEPVESDKAALERMVDDQKDALYVLAEDIIDNGLNPANPAIVCPSTQAGEYVVLDGNRRLVALLALLHPEVIPETKSSLRKKFERLDKSRLGISENDEVRCVVFENKDAALYWVRKQHLGPEEGKGLVEWTPIQKARFEARTIGKIPRGYAAWEATKDGSDQDFLHLIDRMEIEGRIYTNFTRVIDNKKAREIIGIEGMDKNGKLKFTNDGEAKQILRQIVRDLDSGLNVNELRKEPDIVRYTKDVRFRVTGEKPKNSEKTGKTNIRAKSLIPSKTKLPFTDSKIASIVNELQTLKVHQCPLAAAFLLRALIELSVDRFAERNHDYSKMLGRSKDGKTLHYRLVKLFEYLEDGRKGVRRKLANFRKAMIDNKQVKLADELNSYVHNRTFMPMPEDLITTWGNIEEMMRMIWSDTKPNMLTSDGTKET